MWCGCSTKAEWLSDVIFIRTQTSASLPVSQSSPPDPLHPAGQVHMWLALQRESSRLDCQFPNVRGSYWPPTHKGNAQENKLYTSLLSLTMSKLSWENGWMELHLLVAGEGNTPTSLSNTHITFNDIIVWHHSDVTVARDSQRCIHW